MTVKKRKSKNPNFVSDVEVVKRFFEKKGLTIPPYFIRLMSNLKYKETQSKVFMQVKWYLQKKLTIREVQHRWSTRPKALKDAAAKLESKKVKENKAKEGKTPWINIISTPMRD